MNFQLVPAIVGAVLVLIQVLAALPWMAVLFATRSQRAAWSRQSVAGWWLPRVAVGLAAVALVGALAPNFIQDQEALDTAGKVYGALLQLQLTADFFVIVFAVLLLVWPKGGAVALAAFREGVRQPMFWLLTGAALFLIVVSPYIPYFTFGEDHIMMKELGYDTIMLAAVAFGALAATLFVSEEIEGRTAITLMSKPVSRRQFLLGKYVGILLAALVMISLLGWCFQEIVVYKRWLDKLDPVPPAPWLVDALTRLDLPPQPTAFLFGVGTWVNNFLETLPGLALNFSQVMVLLGISVALATRLPMVVNLATVLVIYFLAHLTPVLVSIGQKSKETNPGSTVSQMLSFMANLFDTILPGLDFFRVSNRLVSDQPLPMGQLFAYVGSVIAYGLMYTVIVLLLGLILFEDRDLA
jgi:ABC-type transport system involved in multi-copper enzyme maturation permease subunit